MFKFPKLVVVLRHFLDRRWSAALLSLLLTLSCDETLPDRGEPSKLLKGNTNFLLQPGLSDTNLVASFTIVNLYDDVLDGTASFQGSIDIVLVRDQSVRRHAVLTGGNVTSSRGYNPNTKHLTITPGDSIQLQFRWDLTDNNGKNLADTLDVDGLAFLLHKDPFCPYRWLGGPETFAVSGQMIVFDHLGSVVFPTRLYKLCYAKTIPNSPACGAVVYPQGCP